MGRSATWAFPRTKFRSAIKALWIKITACNCTASWKHNTFLWNRKLSHRYWDNNLTDLRDPSNFLIIVWIKMFWGATRPLFTGITMRKTTQYLYQVVRYYCSKANVFCTCIPFQIAASWLAIAKFVYFECKHRRKHHFRVFHCYSEVPVKLAINILIACSFIGKRVLKT